jgi:hypothetical protein
VTGPWIAAFAALWICVLVVGLLALGLMRRVIGVLEAAESRGIPEMELSSGLQPGTRLPAVELWDEDRRTVGLTDLAGQRFVLLLLTHGCEPCRELARSLERFELLRRDVPVVVITDESEEAFAIPSWVRILYQRDSDAFEALDVNSYPFAFAIDRDLTVIEASGATAEVVEKLVEVCRGEVKAAQNGEALLSTQPLAH